MHVLLLTSCFLPYDVNSLPAINDSYAMLNLLFLAEGKILSSLQTNKTAILQA